MIVAEQGRSYTTIIRPLLALARAQCSFAIASWEEARTALSMDLLLVALAFHMAKPIAALYVSERCGRSTSTCLALLGDVIDPKALSRALRASVA